MAYSPRPWGCFRKKRLQGLKKTVFPTPVGVFLHRAFAFLRPTSIPHARGGVSGHPYILPADLLYSPRPWGCFRIPRSFATHSRVFPTPVGVFPGMACPLGTQLCIPHARGGVSKGRRRCEAQSWYSPRPWGCFYTGDRCPIPQSVFPTPVGVFLIMASLQLLIIRIPHARGGVSARHWL